jgi:hypothetical protein
MTFVMPGNQDVRLLMGAFLIIRNEGSATADVNISGYMIDRRESLELAEKVLNPAGEDPPTRLVPGVARLSPGQQIGLIVRDGPTVGEWVKEGDQPRVLRIEAQVSTEGAHQAWELRMEAGLLQQSHFNASEFRVVPHRPVTTNVEELPRIYPPRTWLPWRQRAH